MRPARVVATVAVALFWVGTAVAGSVAPGYSARDDVVSSLAGRGSSVAVLGIASILCLAVAHLAGAVAVRSAAYARPVSAALVGAAVATLVIAGFRVSCSDGAGECRRVDPPGDAVDLVHTIGVVSFELMIVVAMLGVAVTVLRHRSGWPAWLAVLSVAAAVGSVTLLLSVSGPDSGLWQRLWIGTNLGWLLLATWTVRPQDTGASGWTATSPAR